MLSAGSQSFTYDANGNTLTRDDGGAVTQYAYDSLNRLVSQVAPDSHHHVFYLR